MGSEEDLMCGEPTLLPYTWMALAHCLACGKNWAFSSLVDSRQIVYCVYTLKTRTTKKTLLGDPVLAQRTKTFMAVGIVKLDSTEKERYL